MRQRQSRTASVRRAVSSASNATRSDAERRRRRAGSAASIVYATQSEHGLSCHRARSVVRARPVVSSSSVYCQSTVCRFESMTLSCSNMRALRPVLDAWLAVAESRRRDGDAAEHREGPTGPWTESAAVGPVCRRRRRATIAGPERRALEAYFAVESRPSRERIAHIASKLCLDRSVVRVWYCNQRQKQKRLKNWNDDALY